MIVDVSGKIMFIEEILIIDIKFGWKKGIKIIFFEKGNEKLGVIFVDLVFVIDEKFYDIFKCDGNDLIMIKKVLFVEVLIGCSFFIFILDGRVLNVSVFDVIYFGYEKVLLKEGMLVVKELGRKGNL